MNMNMDLSKYVVPTLGICCVAAGLLVVSGLRTPADSQSASDSDSTDVRVPRNLELTGYTPTMEEVVAKHLFVPERMATGENSFSDLLVKGVYVGNERNAVFSLKSKPEANLRVWMGDEDAALEQVVDDRDPRKPIVNFLGEWQIRSIDFSGVTVEHLITGEQETYMVDYKPAKHVKDSAQAGYGQGMVADTVPNKAAPAAQARAPARPGQAKPQASGIQTAAGRVGAYMQRMSPQQRQQFMQQLQKQNAAANQKKQGDNTSSKRNGASNSGNKKGSKRSR